ncbi:SPOR domain-containing protein [Neobacillus sp. DY30]|uniref:SPOR domain-containing protein n=1 Tax=Neobacillus sp. DY30 TaxID=3047871 RepID=UPI0024BF72AC|nr:SPOR domain-containing protein [Neobacillus sp. DY30]WHX99482.1 SPOR domain-containing protein [Neobacillus sp. DY30]
MDKPNRGNTIKIKLNGEDQTFREEPIKKEQESSKDSFTKVINIDEDFNDQDVFLEAAAAKESVDESFDWIIPESAENDIQEYKVISSQKDKKGGKKKTPSFTTFSMKRNGSVLKSIIVTAVFAILIGTSFGVLMLKLVISENSKPTVTEPVVAGNGSNKGSEVTGGKSSSVAIAAQTMYIVQGGAFSSKDAASGAANEVKGKGAPAQTLTMNNKEFMFLGVADSIETAKRMEGHYEANGFDDVLPKQIPVAEKTVSNINEAEKGFLEAAPAIYQQLSKVTSNAIVAGSIASESSKEITGLGKQINQTTKQLKNEKVINLNKELSSALKSVEAYQEKKNKDSLVEAQQHLLNYLSIYYSL